MDPICKLVLFFNLVYVISQAASISSHGRPQIIYAAANSIDWPQMDWFNSKQQQQQQQQQNQSKSQVDMFDQINDLDHSQNDSASHSELAAQKRLAQMLNLTREKLSLFSFGPLNTNCLEFNWTLHEASRELNNLIEVIEPNSHPTDVFASVPSNSFMPVNSMLHEDIDTLRKLQALNAYEALGSAVSLYFECISQLGLMGNLNQLTELLPIGFNITSLGSLVENIAQSGVEEIQFAEFTENGERDSNHLVVKRDANDVLMKQNDGDINPEVIIEVETDEAERGLLGKISSKASDLYKKTNDLIF